MGLADVIDKVSDQAVAFMLHKSRQLTLRIVARIDEPDADQSPRRHALEQPADHSVGIIGVKAAGYEELEIIRRAPEKLLRHHVVSQRLSREVIAKLLRGRVSAHRFLEALEI